MQVRGRERPWEVPMFIAEVLAVWLIAAVLIAAIQRAGQRGL